MNPSPKSAYIHIPFCKSICTYCDFCKLLKNPVFEQSYVEALLEDIKKANLMNMKTIYVGGGTPSCLEDGLFASLLAELGESLGEGYEFTVECNPESLTPEKARIMKAVGVNRVSIGLQSANPKYLSYLGRTHTFKAVEEAIITLRSNGIKNINVDLMYGFEGQNEEELLDDIKAILSLKVPHLSTYSLILEKGTILYGKGVKETEGDILANFYEIILKELRKAGYRRYEVSNFALPGYESRHNLVYWRDEQYYGLGLGASGYENGVRYRITPSINNYLKGIRKVEEEKVNKADDRSYYLLTLLRLEEGFDLREFRDRFDEDLLFSRKTAIEKHLKYGNVIVENDRIKVTDKGMLRLDSILVDLL